MSDGDTLVLSDQRRVRLIGLNTLELNARYKPDQRWAKIATRRLEDLIDDKPINLAIGLEEFDRHGRTLAHIVLADGTLATTKLIKQGLALAVTVGANTRCFEAFHSAEKEARAAQRGIWQQPGKWMNSKKTMSHRDRGFQLISSTVVSVEIRKSNPGVSLENGLVVKFDKHWSSVMNSDRLLPKNLLGKKIELRGWIGNSAGQPIVTLSHPANLKILAN